MGKKASFGGWRTFLYLLLQWTWGLPQTLAGAVMLLIHRRSPRSRYHGALVVRWNRDPSLSLGPFLFVSARPGYYRNLADSLSMEELVSRLLVHEYGHTIQSLLLGPLYLPVIGLPSLIWSSSGRLLAKRRRERLPYCAFFTERWANRLGERVTGEASLGNLFLD